MCNPEARITRRIAERIDINRANVDEILARLVCINTCARMLIYISLPFRAVVIINSTMRCLRSKFAMFLHASVAKVAKVVNIHHLRFLMANTNFYAFWIMRSTHLFSKVY